MLSEERRDDPTHGLLVEDLRLAFCDLVPAMDAAIAARDALDAFLLAAGGSQILHDALEDDPGHLLRAASMARGSGPQFASRVVPATATAGARAIDSIRRRRRNRRGLAESSESLDAAVGVLADCVLRGGWDPAATNSARGAIADAMVATAGLADTVLRLPSCFQSFDQHPRDVAALAARTLGSVPEAARGAVVIGVRTSGSYLAPLLSAALGAAGAPGVPWLTVRPGRLSTARSRALLEEGARRGWTALVIDDPPGTGASVARVGEQLGALGYAPGSVVLVLATLQDGSIPSRLAPFKSVVLEWPDWDIHRRLAPEAIRGLVEPTLTAGTEIDALEPFVLASAGFHRSHAQLGVRLATSTAGVSSTSTLVAEGSGLGYFGRHGIALSRALPGLVPEVLAFHDGVSLRRWLPDESRINLDSPQKVRRAVDYVTRRRDALPARRDASDAMVGQQPAWEVASRLLAAPYGALGLALRSAGLDAAVRAMLAPREPSVVDGQTGGRSWFDDEGAMVKVSFADRAFSNLDLACYDAAYDVAGLALGTPTRELAEMARESFLEASGLVVDDERWLLYRLVHLWDRRRLQQIPQDAAELEMSRVWQDWVASRLLGAPPGRSGGPTWVIDIDGVLETSRFGAPVLTPAAASALRALRLHGHRPLLATGRSTLEVQDRCARYGLDAGVAEYGCATFDAATGGVTSLVDEAGAAALDAAREHLGSLAHVELSSSYRIAIRAFRVRSGRRVALSAGEVEAVVSAAGHALVAHPGIAQTDFVPAGIDKARAVTALLASLGAGPRADVAVGDSVGDLTMLAGAMRGFVPAHSRELATGTVVATRRAYQLGFSDAVATVLGHQPGACGTCAIPTRPGPRVGLISALLEGTEGGRRRGAELAPTILARSRQVLSRPAGQHRAR